MSMVYDIMTYCNAPQSHTDTYYLYNYVSCFLLYQLDPLLLHVLVTYLQFQYDHCDLLP